MTTTAEESRLRECLMNCASTVRCWRKTIKTKAQGLVLDDEDIRQQNEDKRLLLDRAEELRQEVLEFNQKAQTYNNNNQAVIVKQNCKSCWAFLAEIQKLITNKQKITDKLDVISNLRECSKGKKLSSTL